MATSTPTFSSLMAQASGQAPQPVTQPVASQIPPAPQPTQVPATTGASYDDPVVATQAKNLTKAIFQHESGMDYNKVGDAGTSHGAGQWQPDTWKAEAQDVLGDANAPMTPENQSVVAQGTIRKWIAEGLNAAQIAAKWNSGQPDGWETKVGVATINGQKVPYNVPKYVKTVTDLYQQYKNQAPASVSQPQNTSVMPDVGEIGTQLSQNLASRFQQGTQSLNKLITSGTKGDVRGIASGALQTAGAVAGGAGDVFNAGLQLVPGAQAIENDVSKLLGNFAQTDTGQKIVSGLSSFAQQHPEISGDLSAIINIGTVFPLFRGLMLIKGGLTDAAVSSLRQPLTDAAENELRSSITGKGVDELAQAERRGLDPLGYLTKDYQNLPSVVENPAGRGFIYDGTKAAQRIQTTLSNDEETLQGMLSQGIKKNVGVDLNAVRQRMLKDMVDEFPVSAKGGQAIRAVNEFLDNVAPTTGGRNVISINELNGLKRDVGSGVNWLNLGTKSGEIKSAMYRSLMTQVEEYASQAGVKDVGAINKIMAEKIAALKALGRITGKTVKQSKVGGVIREVGKDIAGGAAELAGSRAGVPFASTLAGRGLYRILPGATPLTPVRLLGRSGRGTVKSSLMQGLLKSATAQALRSTTTPPPTR